MLYCDLLRLVVTVLTLLTFSRGLVVFNESILSQLSTMEQQELQLPIGEKS